MNFADEILKNELTHQNCKFLIKNNFIGFLIDVILQENLKVSEKLKMMIILTKMVLACPKETCRYFCVSKNLKNLVKFLVLENADGDDEAYSYLIYISLNCIYELLNDIDDMKSLLDLLRNDLIMHLTI